MSTPKETAAATKRRLIREGKIGCGKCVKCFCDGREIQRAMQKRKKTPQEITAILTKRFAVVPL